MSARGGIGELGADVGTVRDNVLKAQGTHCSSVQVNIV